MKFSTATVQEPSEIVTSQKVSFPAGIVGFPAFNEAEIIYKKEELPFMVLKGEGELSLAFYVAEPAALVPEYEIEIADPDVAALELKDASEALILNIVTAQTKGSARTITINLLGPIVVNRRTLKARQIIIGNCQKYSARHILFQEGKE